MRAAVLFPVSPPAFAGIKLGPLAMGVAVAGYIALILSGAWSSAVTHAVGGAVFMLSSVIASLCMVATVAWVVCRKLPVFAVLSVIALALAGWSVVYAPIKTKRIVKVAQEDGGVLPVLDPQSVIAVIDRTAPRSAALSLCREECAAILRDVAIKGIFLPRYTDPNSGQVHGVIYSRATFGHQCAEEAQPQGGRAVCIASRPGTLSDVTHLLETTRLGHRTPTALGISDGSQLRLTDLRQGRVLVQQTAYRARVPARVPIFGDVVANSASPRVLPRLRTRVLTTRRNTTPLIGQLKDALRRQLAGLD